MVLVWPLHCYCRRSCLRAAGRPRRLPHSLRPSAPAAACRPRACWQQRHRGHQAVGGALQHHRRRARLPAARLPLCVCAERGGWGRGGPADGERRHCRWAGVCVMAVVLWWVPVWWMCGLGQGMAALLFQAHVSFVAGCMGWAAAHLSCQPADRLQTPPTACPTLPTWPSAGRPRQPSASPCRGRRCGAAAACRVRATRQGGRASCQPSSISGLPCQAHRHAVKPPTPLLHVPCLLLCSSWTIRSWGPAASLCGKVTAPVHARSSAPLC